LNDFNSFFGNFETIIRSNERSRLPWDAPNRFLFWGAFSLGYGFTLVPVFAEDWFRAEQEIKKKPHARSK
jgi:hypothetical protein